MLTNRPFTSPRSRPCDWKRQKSPLFIGLAALAMLFVSSCSSGSPSASAPTPTISARTQSTLYYVGTPTSAGTGGGSSTGGSTAPPSATLVAVDGATGSPLWSDSLSAPAASVLASTGVVYVSLVNTTTNGVAQGTLEALRAATGKALWQTPSAGGLTLALALDGRALYVSKIAISASGIPQSGTLQALNPATGAAMWSTPLSAGIAASATLDGGTLYLLAGTASATSQTTQVSLIAADATTGTIRWQKALADATPEAPVVANGIIYAAEQTPIANTGTPPSPVVEALNASTGASMWRQTLAGTPIGYPLVANNAGVVTVVQIPPASPCQSPQSPPKAGTPTTTLCEVGTTLIDLSAASGAQAWSTPLPGSELAGAPQASASTLYTANLNQDASGTPTGAVEAYGLSDGKLIWNHVVAEGVPNPIQLSGGSLYLVATPIQQGPAPQPPQSTLEALSATDGSLMWKKSLGSEEVMTLLAVSGA